MSGHFFVVGTQRSGTTLLFRMLDSHPRFTGINEWWHLHNYLTDPDVTPDSIRSLASEHLDLGLPDGSWESKKLAIDTVFDELAKERGKKACFLKDPRLTHFLDAWGSDRPETKFVFIIRDPRAVVNSYLQHGVAGNAYAGGELWAKEVALQDAFRERHPERSLLIHYEELIDDARATLERVCDFLGETFDADMLTYYKQPENTVINPHNVETKSPIKDKNKTKWMENLSSKEVALIESAAGMGMSAHGYDSMNATPEVHSAWKAWYRLHNRLKHEIRWQRQSGWNGIRRRIPGLRK